jgi:hypothetical protein
MRARLFLTAVLLLTAPACALSRQLGQAEPVDLASKDQGYKPESALSEGPVELGCPPTPLVRGDFRWATVVLDLRVLPDGAVDPVGVYLFSSPDAPDPRRPTPDW